MEGLQTEERKSCVLLSDLNVKQTMLKKLRKSSPINRKPSALKKEKEEKKKKKNLHKI